MNESEEVARVRRLLKAWDDGEICLGEFETLVRRETFDESTFKHIQEQDSVYYFTLGCFGKQTHNYGLYDISSQSQGFYSFSLKNIIRFYWNKLCRYMKWCKEWIF